MFHQVSGNTSSRTLTFLLISLTRFSGSSVNALAADECSGASDCIEKELRELEQVNLELRSAMENLKNVQTKQEQNIKKLKNYIHEKDSSFSGFTLEIYGKLDPCSGGSDYRNIIESVAQLEGKIYFTCHGLDYIPVYHGQTLKYLYNLTLPSPKGARSGLHVMANHFEGALYLIVPYSYQKVSKDSAFSIGDFVYKALTKDYRWTWVKTPENFHVERIGNTANGQMMLANRSHVLFYDRLGSISKTLEYTLSASVRSYAVKNFIQTDDGSLLIPGYRNITLLDSNGRYLDTYAEGPVIPVGNHIEDYISDITEGPTGTILISEINRNEVLILDTSRDQLYELNAEVQKSYRISFDSKYSRLVVLEWLEEGTTCCRIFSLAT